MTVQLFGHVASIALVHHHFHHGRRRHHHHHHHHHHHCTKARATTMAVTTADCHCSLHQKHKGCKGHPRLAHRHTHTHNHTNKESHKHTNAKTNRHNDTNVRTLSVTQGFLGAPRTPRSKNAYEVNTNLHPQLEPGFGPLKYILWMDDILHHLRNHRMMIPL